MTWNAITSCLACWCCFAWPRLSRGSSTNANWPESLPASIISIALSSRRVSMSTRTKWEGRLQFTAQVNIKFRKCLGICLVEHESGYDTARVSYYPPVAGIALYRSYGLFQVSENCLSGAYFCREIDHFHRRIVSINCMTRSTIKRTAATTHMAACVA